MTEIIRLWRGEVALVRAFWHWAVLGGLAVNGVTSLLFLALAVNDRMVLALIAGYALSIPYNIFVTVGVWRAADRHPGDRRWAELARAVTAAGMAVLSLT